MTRRWLLFPAALYPAAAFAHAGHSHEIGWTLDPLITVPLGLTLLVFLVGLWRLSLRAGRGRRALTKKAWLFGAGWLTLAGALVSPLHEAGEMSFTMHMIEHEIIMLVSALLLAASAPGATLLWGLPQPLRRLAAGVSRWRAWDLLSQPLVATLLQSLAIVVWHVPALFDQTLRSDTWHIAQHVSFVGSALLFWWAMIHRASALVAAGCLFLTSIIGGGLGALMALSVSPWYEGYAALGMTPIGLSPEEDQQLAGLLMWVPGGLWHLLAALWFVSRGLKSEDHKATTA